MIDLEFGIEDPLSLTLHYNRTLLTNTATTMLIMVRHLLILIVFKSGVLRVYKNTYDKKNIVQSITIIFLTGLVILLVARLIEEIPIQLRFSQSNFEGPT